MTSLFDTDAFNAALFYPQKIRSDPPDGARDHFVDVTGGARLHLRLHDRPELPLLLYFHGNGEVVADYDELAPAFADAGVALAVSDYRGYGQSTGEPTLRAAIGDAHAVLDAALALVGPERRVLVMGRSLGGAPAAELCQKARPQVVGYVFESAAADLAGVVRRRGVRADPSEADRAVFDPLPKLARCTTPALVMHGEIDALITVDEAVRSAAALSKALFELVRIPNRGHNDISYDDAYWAAVRRFVAHLSR